MNIGRIEQGVGETVVLLHCSSSSGVQWRQLVEQLADRFHVVAPDLIGYGETDPWPPDKSLQLADETDLIRQVLPSPDKSVHLVGHSYGGLVALAAAQTAALPIKSLTLIEPIAFWLLREAGEAVLFEEILAIARDFNAGIDRGRPEAGVRAYFDYWSGAGAWRAASPDLRRYVLATAAKTYREWPNAFEPATPLAAFAHLTMPSLLIRGTRTQPSTARVVELLATVLPNHALAEIPGAGHMSPITHVDPVNAHIVDFLARWHPA